MSHSLADKHVLLTGASGGLGQALAQQLAAAGCDLWLCARDQARLEALAEQLRQQYPQQRFTALACDLSDPATPGWLQQQLDNEALDILINNAGMSSFALYQEQSASDIQAIVQLNLLSPMLLSHALLEHLAHPDGLIVNIGSIFGSIGHPGYVTYCTSKFGLRGFSQALGRELRGSGARVLYVGPRAIDTPLNHPNAVALLQHTGSQMDSPQWVAEQVIAAMTSQRSEVLLGSPEKWFARINSILPAVVGNALHKQLATIRQLASRQSH
ncbi:SDR family oxidoreductase [Pokkaliibacter sp. MBI-7]|uniref:SDR family oxidoreductase n=1 Tax=Pokkaliibacter sp. MBI-7 TaxID=3040600 RepID=UPI00244B5D53|nr:SDR family oxidoreductase [Pokkaliibacter sp. MBI-7]MDH2433456.1 SDR family oxidoreductase [Pokkaliibacter sp. MBI-7]